MNEDASGLLAKRSEMLFLPKYIVLDLSTAVPLLHVNHEGGY